MQKIIVFISHEKHDLVRSIAEQASKKLKYRKDPKNFIYPEEPTDVAESGFDILTLNEDDRLCAGRVGHWTFKARIVHLSFKDPVRYSLEAIKKPLGEALWFTSALVVGIHHDDSFIYLRSMESPCLHQPSQKELISDIVNIYKNEQ